MKRLAVIFGILFTVLIGTSCNNDDGVNFHFTALEITGATLPDSFQLNERYQITVTYTRPNDCTYFEGFDVVQKDLTVRDVVAIGSVLTDEACAESTEEVQATFNFVVLYDQTYLFRFWQGEDENGNPIYLQVEVPVE
jgi:hypothetical protein